jgi:hypothetical protein
MASISSSSSSSSSDVESRESCDMPSPHGPPEARVAPQPTTPPIPPSPTPEARAAPPPVRCLKLGSLAYRRVQRALSMLRRGRYRSHGEQHTNLSRPVAAKNRRCTRRPTVRHIQTIGRRISRKTKCFMPASRDPTVININPAHLAVDDPDQLLDHVIKTVLRRLPDSVITMLARYLREVLCKSPWTVGTACSGSELFITVLESVERCLIGDDDGACTPADTRLRLMRCFRHLFGCGLDGDKRDDIRHNFPSLETLFTHIEALGHATAMNAIPRNGRQQLAAVSSVFLFVAGFSCKSVQSIYIP